MAATCLASVFGSVVAQTPTPRAPPQVDPQQLEEALGRAMGRPPPQARAAPGAVEVVIGTGHSAPVLAVAASPDGRYLLSSGFDETTRLWDIAAGQEVRSIASPSLAPALALGFSAGGERLLIGYGEFTEVLDNASGAARARLEGGSMTPLLINPGGRLASVQTREGVSIVDPATGAALWTVPGAGMQLLALSGDGRLLALRPTNTARSSASGPNASANEMLRSQVELWDLAAHRLQGRVTVQQRSGFDGRMALSPDGRLLAVEAGDGNLQLYEVTGGALLATLATAAPVRASVPATLTFSPDGGLLAFASVDGIARIWRVPGYALVASPSASALGFSADGRQLFLGKSEGGAPVTYDLQSGRETPIAAGASELLDLSLIAGGAAAVTASGPGGARVWDLATGQLLVSLPCPNAASARSVAASPVRPLVAIGCADGSLSLTEIAAPYATHALRPAAPERGFANVLVRFSEDGRHLLTVVDDELTAWDADSGQILRRVTLPPPPPPPPLPFAKGVPQSSPTTPATGQTARSEVEMVTSPDRVQALALRGDGALAAVGRATDLTLWDLAAGKPVARLAPPAPAMPGGAGTPGAYGAGSFDFRDLFQSFNPQRNGATGLAFSRDGRVLLASGSYGQRLWDLASGREIRPPAPAHARTAPPTARDPMAMLGQLEMAASPAAALSPDGRLAARAYGATIRLVDLASGTELGELTGHTSIVTALAFSSDGGRLVSSGRDGALRVWQLAERREAAALYAIGREDYVDVTPDRYYRVSRHQLHGIAFRVDDQVFPFEQFDLRFNRPDLVMQRLGLASPALVAAYQRAYVKRLKKMGFTPGALGSELHLPNVEVLSRDVPITTAASTLTVRVRASDDRVPLDRLNVSVNDVPVYGSGGVAIAHGSQLVERDLEVPLVTGHNKIQISALNRQGAESLRRTLYTNSSAGREPWDVWVVAIGVSAYRNPRYALRFAAKDAADVAQAFRALDGRGGTQRAVHVLLVTDQRATREGIRAAKQWLQQAQRADLAVVFAAGHGIVDDHQNYFYGTWDIDADNPAAAGLPFEEFEDLLDGIKPLRKVLLVDTCFSGEIDEDEPRAIASAEGGARVTMRRHKAARNLVALAEKPAAADSEPAEAVGLQQDLFADLRRGTGAVAISSSSGNEYSLEGAQWNNGVFTYAILQGLSGRADRDGDGTVSVAELQLYVTDAVRQLTRGAQNPVVRRENLDFDFDVY